jgi:hypothetical protein
LHLTLLSIDHASHLISPYRICPVCGGTILHAGQYSRCGIEIDSMSKRVYFVDICRGCANNVGQEQILLSITHRAHRDLQKHLNIPPGRWADFVQAWKAAYDTEQLCNSLPEDSSS